MTVPPDFAAYPRARLRLQWNRRQLLASLRTELRVRSERDGGGADIRIGDLGTFPDAILELMTPRLVRIYQPEPFPAPFAATVALIDGATPLRGIAERLSASLAWEAGHAFAYARGVFLHLVARGVCLPVR